MGRKNKSIGYQNIHRLVVSVFFFFYPFVVDHIYGSQVKKISRIIITKNKQI
jgi:hypothetical protein